MCDFHSFSVNLATGAVAHAVSNRHTDAQRTAGWGQNDTLHTYFVECEWNGVGEFPGAEKVICSDTPASMLTDIAKKSIESHCRRLHEALVSFKHLGPGEYFSGPEYVDVRRGVAQNPSTPPDVLRVLATDPEACVRYSVVQNPSAPSEVLASLAKDPDKDVRRGVAQNPSAPSEVLASLAKDLDKDVRRWVAQNPSAPSEVLASLAKDPDGNVRRGVAWNTSAPSKVLMWNISTPIEGLWFTPGRPDKSGD